MNQLRFKIMFFQLIEESRNQLKNSIFEFYRVTTRYNKLSKLKKMEACGQRMVKCVVRAYYSNEFVAVTDAVLQLQSSSGVTTDAVAQLVKLSPRLVREVLVRLHVDGLLSRVESSSSVSTSASATNALPVCYRFDYIQVCNATKYRHHAILQKLNTLLSTSSNEPRFVCPTRDCRRSQTLRTALDLIEEQGATTAGFVCDSCFTTDPLTQQRRPTTLVLVAATQPTDTQLLDKKLRFNTQVAPLLHCIASFENAKQAETQN
jgi:transcription initiation factor IIE alpha subunit